jgi:hypothetical protein
MKNTFQITEQEKKEILEQHNFFKRALQSKSEVKRLMVNEQAAPTSGGGVEFLKAARDKGCKIAKGAVLKSAPGKPTILYKKADYNSDNGFFKIGDELYIKDNFTFDVVTTDENGQRTMTYTNRTWNCPELTKPFEDQVNANIDRTKQEGDWKKREDITDTDANVNNPQMYQKQVVNGVTLYRRVSGKGITAALDKRQQDVVDKWLAQGAELEKDVDAEQAKTWTRKLVSPKSEGLFSEDFYMYFPPNTVNNAAILTAFKAAVTDQTANSKSDCKEAIEAYYTAFKIKAKIEPNTMDSMKEKVQACIYQFNGNWGAGAFTKIDDYVDILTGVKSGGPSSYGPDAKWRLK